MANISSLKEYIQIEEVRENAAVSSATGAKLGGVNNFLLDAFQYSKVWNLNGAIYTLTLPYQRFDGFYSALLDCKIVGVMASNGSGTSGVTEFDIIRHPQGGGPAVSMLTTRPSIGSNTAFARFSHNVRTNTTLFQSPSTTLPVFLSVDVFKGDFVTINLTSSQADARDLNIQLFFEPTAV